MCIYITQNDLILIAFTYNFILELNFIYHTVSEQCLYDHKVKYIFSLETISLQPYITGNKYIHMFNVHGKYTNAIYKNHSFSWLIQFSIYTHQHPLQTYNKNNEYFVTTCEHNIVIIPLFRVKLLSLVPFEIITISINLFIIIRKHNEYILLKCDG